MDTQQEKELLRICHVEDKQPVIKSLIKINDGYLVKRTEGKSISYRGLDPKYDTVFLDYLKKNEGE